MNSSSGSDFLHAVRGSKKMKPIGRILLLILSAGVTALMHSKTHLASSLPTHHACRTHRIPDSFSRLTDYANDRAPRLSAGLCRFGSGAACSLYPGHWRAWQWVGSTGGGAGRALPVPVVRQSGDRSQPTHGSEDHRRADK